MWTIRRVSARIKSQPLSSITFRACNAKVEPTRASYMGNIEVGGSPLPISDGSLLLRRFSSQARGPQSSFVGYHSFSSQAGSESEKELIKEVDTSESESEIELDLLDTEEEAAEKTDGERRGSSGLSKVLVDSSSRSAKTVLDKWVKGHDLYRSEVSQIMFDLRRRKMYWKALQVSEWLESHVKIEFNERDYASRVDLIAKVRGTQKARAYIDKIPESFKGEMVYRTLLSNCVLNNEVKKTEKVFNRMKDLKFPITSFACNQLLLLYKRTNKKKMADVLLFMEKEGVKPSLFTYRLLIEAIGTSNDIIGIEQVLETLKAEGLEPDSGLQAVLEAGDALVKQMSEDDCRLGPLTWDALVKLYIEAGEIEKADSVLNKASQQLNMKPLFATYMMLLDHYAKKGDVHNAEKIFHRMRQVGYVSIYSQYDSLLQAYINAKAPLYGFRERLEADNVFPSKTLADRLAQVDAFEKTAVSDLLD